MSEDELLASVTSLAAWLRLSAYHTFDSRRSAPGFPDMVIAGPGGVIFAELKSAHGKLTKEQAEWRYVLELAGQAYKLWHPKDWATGVIADTLKGIASCSSRNSPRS